MDRSGTFPGESPRRRSAATAGRSAFTKATYLRRHHTSDRPGWAEGSRWFRRVFECLGLSRYPVLLGGRLTAQMEQRGVGERRLLQGGAAWFTATASENRVRDVPERREAALVPRRR